MDIHKNPYGCVIGFNAIFENELAAHYALMPLERLDIKGKKIKALISINTATGKNHQGRGLLQFLQKTYAESKNQGFGIVFGLQMQTVFQDLLKS